MPKTSAGLLVYRRTPGGFEVLLAHPGGPFFKGRDAGAWSIPKGLPEPGEDLLSAARREFSEETGATIDDGDFFELSPIQQKSGKIVHAWAVERDLDVTALRSNTFTMQWPPGSGRLTEFPEVDRAEFFPFDVARKKINPAQVKLIDELERKLLR
jgi:predicted NUDIX family NTP pyrophosphohydrolase